VVADCVERLWITRRRRYRGGKSEVAKRERRDVRAGIWEIRGTTAGALCR
jgi:hypothetical protein